MNSKFSVPKFCFCFSEKFFIALFIAKRNCEEVMENSYDNYQWGMFYSKSNKEYCVVLRGDKEINFGKTLSTM